MSSHDSSERRATVVSDALVANVPHQAALRPHPPARSVEEVGAFLEELEAVFGRDDRRRDPITGDRFLL